MNINLKRTRRLTALLGLLMLLSVVLASCVDLDEVPEVSPGDIPTASDISDNSGDELSTPDGCTEAPQVAKIVNIDPYTVAISGTCEEGAKIMVSGGKEYVETTANGTYFIIETELLYQKNLLKLTAQVEGKEVSLEREVIAEHDATAESLLDGNSVSVGANSLLYFDKMLDDASGKNLYTVSQLNNIRDYVNDTVTSYKDRAGSQKVELIYVLIPDVTTIYPEIFPEGAVEDPYTTVYDQILDTLNNTKAKVVDMREQFMQLRDDEDIKKNYGGLYRVTDSSLSDYGAYLTYSALMNVVADNFPEAAPRALDEFEAAQVKANGGNLVDYREFDDSVINEEIVTLTPKFDLKLGSNTAGNSMIASLRKYVKSDDADYDYFTEKDTADGINGIAERWIIDTARNDANLPNAIIHRDYGALSFSDILAERFNKSLLVASGEHSINLSTATQYAAEDKAVVDYIIVIISEENMDTAFSNVK